MTSASGRRAWPIIDRASQVEAIRSVVVDTHRCGVVVTGETGIGKTTATLAAARRLVERPLHVHGSEVGRTVPYAALAPWLMAYAPPTGLVDVAAIAAALRDAAAGLNDDGVPVIVVDPAPLVDELSAHALAQVAKAGLARVMIVGRTLADIPEPFLEMWRDGLLGEHRLESWTVEEIAELLTRHLGAPVALWSVKELARIAGYQPLFLRYLVEDQLDQRNLVLQEGTWVLTRPPTGASSELATVMRARLDERSDAERRVLELVALAGEIDYDVLEGLVGAVVLEALLDTDLIEVDAAAPAQVRLRHRTVAELVRGAVPFARRRRLRAEVLEALGSRLPAHGPALLSFAVWTLDCGAELEPAVAIEAARQANRFYDPHLALRLAQQVSQTDLRLAGLAQRSAAYRLLGQVERATSLLTTLTGEELVNQDQTTVGELAEELVLVAATDPQAVPAAEATLAAISPTASGTLAQRLRGLGFELLAAQGRYLEMLPALEEAIGERDDSEEWFLVAGALLEALSLTGRQDDALALVDEVARRLVGIDLDPTAFDIVHAAMFGVFMKCGLWSMSRQTLIDGSVGHDLKMLLIGAAADSAIGMTYVMGGYADDARRHLGQALSQSRVRDVRRTGPQIAAGLAYAAALQGDEAAARSSLAAWRDGPRTYWNISASGDYLAWSARLLVDGLDRCEPGLLALAAEHAARGMVIDQLMVLSAAARAGSVSALGQLAELEIVQPGPFAACVLSWARARRDGDAEALIAAAQQLLALGNPLFAREAASSAVDLGGPSATRARTLAQQATAMLTGNPGSPAVDGLTPREREVSQRAARGETNKDIAAALFLSVRTVESYLQSAFTKLGVRSRTELAELIAE